MTDLLDEVKRATGDAATLIENMIRHGGRVSVPIASWTSETRTETREFWCVPTWHLSDAEKVVKDARAALAALEAAPTDDVVEKVARAIWAVGDKRYEDGGSRAWDSDAARGHHEFPKMQARAAIAAMKGAE